MEIQGHDIPKWLGVIIGGFIFIGGIFRAIFVVQTCVANHGKQIKELEDKMEMFHGKCDDVNTELSQAMTLKGHSDFCKSNNAFLSKKVEEVRECVDNGHKLLAERMDKMDKLREDSKTEQVKRDISIAKTLGRVEEHLKRA